MHPTVKADAASESRKKFIAGTRENGCSLDAHMANMCAHRGQSWNFGVT